MSGSRWKGCFTHVHASIQFLSPPRLVISLCLFLSSTPPPPNRPHVPFSVYGCTLRRTHPSEHANASLPLLLSEPRLLRLVFRDTQVIPEETTVPHSENRKDTRNTSTLYYSHCQHCTLKDNILFILFYYIYLAAVLQIKTDKPKMWSELYFCWLNHLTA